MEPIIIFFISFCFLFVFLIWMIIIITVGVRIVKKVFKNTNGLKQNNSRYNYEKNLEDRIRESGERGESNVRYHLKWLEPDGYKVLNNVQVPNPLESQQIDHIVIGKNGVFHLETKNHGGEHGATISINKAGDWSITRNEKTQGMENPLSQVRRHDKVLREFLKKEMPEVEIPLKEIVVLSNEKTILEGQDNTPITVLKIERLNDFISSFDSKMRLNENCIDQIYSKLSRYCRDIETQYGTKG